MKKYNTPFCELVELETKDIITISADDPDAQYDDTAEAPSGWFTKNS